MVNDNHAPVVRCLVSVIIPVYKRFELADRAILSVLRQSYRPIEVIVVDDFSPEVYSFDFKDSPGGIGIQIIRKSENTGPGAARETGRAASTGSYIAYLDSDDIYAPYFILKCVDYLQANKGVDMVYCHAQFMLEDSTVLDESVKKSNELYETMLPYLLTHGRPWHSSACVRTRNLVDTIGPWKSLWFWEDYEYDTRAALINNQIGYIPEVLCYIDKAYAYKISHNPYSPQKDKSYGLAIYEIAQNIHHSSYDVDEVKNKVIYHLMKSAARNLDHGNADIAQKNIGILLKWVDVLSMNHFFLRIMTLCKGLKMGKLLSRSLRKISNEYRRN